jgi:hypothetical protein
MTTEKIEAFKKAFSEAVDRCVEIGFDFIEIHGAHVRRWGRVALLFYGLSDAFLL